jgi:Holliday junction resolvase RusA-like endonuclease
VTAHQDALAPDIGVMPLPAAAEEVGIRDHLVIVVESKPQPQGSKTRGQWGNVYDDNDAKLRPWREAVRQGALQAIEEMHGPCAVKPLFAKGVPVEVEATFTFARSGAHFGTGRNAAVLKPSAPTWHTVYPDVDKLLRSCFDALTAAGVWADDNQVAQSTPRKVYAGAHRDALRIPGAVIRVRELPR